MGKELEYGMEFVRKLEEELHIQLLPINLQVPLLSMDQDNNHLKVFLRQ